MTTRRVVVAALAAIVVGLAGYAYYDYQASQPCFGFTREEMPAPVARYVCQYDGVQGQYVGGGPGYTILMLTADDEVIGFTVHTDDEDGSVGAIVYFADEDGNVLLDRRDELPELKGQDV